MKFFNNEFVISLKKFFNKLYKKEGNFITNIIIIVTVIIVNAFTL